MTQHNYIPQLPYALEGDELGQRVYNNLRAPIEATVSGNALSEAAQARLERAEAYLANRVPASEISMDIARSTPELGRMAIQDLELPFFEDGLDEPLELS